MENEITEYNPHKNDAVISIIRQQDGNYTGETKKNGVMIRVREVDPQAVVLAIITHE